MENTKKVALALTAIAIATFVLISWVEFCAHYFAKGPFGLAAALSPIFLIPLAFAIYTDIKS